MKPLPPTELLRKLIQEDERSCHAIAKEAGVDKSAVHRFVYGSGLRGDSIDKLCLFYGLELVKRDAKK